MIMKIKIPDRIMNECRESGWEEEEIKEHFLRYMKEAMEDPSSRFKQDFSKWLGDLIEKES